ncbi:MAG: tRNA preQ1(34) S-adenosylmethionine ribosyltransferase-isomerase QueA [Bacteroidota bacterium]|nr:tRNA preQ1(34) S-adenosylmethionine ribosyltransferase-isomerase QueA [Candidatus Kapabacteria bacterium]MCS7302150.1 tRNA preQ1(34) S-adenosylmethionine ribosyltransferase-isomerase QueA [Candidatus Kapabacteria bacterium]MDW8271225.1 tRNA preQ1(34) S-adenosylmethionine ribosyltransferase-isomerase QueA [Bacteroidota bacterium]
MASNVVKLSDLKVNIPASAIAQYPLPKRENARMLVVDRATGELRDEKFKNIVKFFQKGDVLVLNDAKAFPAHLVGTKEKGDIPIDVYLLRELRREERLWDIVVEPARKVRIGNKIYFDGGRFYCEIIENTTTRGRIARFSYEGDLGPVLNRIGQMALPSYITREHTEDDRERFQTVFAHPGKKFAIAPPTAGLHFTKDILKAIAKQGVSIVHVTLYIGQCVLEPIEVEDLSKHRMYSEYFEVSRETAETINRALKARKNVYIVGCSTLRALESSILTVNMIKPNRGWTDKYIFPPYEFKFNFRFLTNFHPHGSSSLVLTSAIAGKELLVRSYQHAIKQGYRFFAYGDAMLII